MSIAEQIARDKFTDEHAKVLDAMDAVVVSRSALDMLRKWCLYEDTDEALLKAALRELIGRVPSRYLDNY